MKAMILAAGEGTRLAPLTERRPKPILPLLNQPLLAHTLCLLRLSGIKEAVVNVHHRAARIIEALGDGAAWGVHLIYSEEERLLGTAGGVKRAERHFDGPFLVLYGDNLFDVDLLPLIELHRARGADGTIGLFRAPDPTAVGLVETDREGRVLRFVEKPSLSQVTTDWANAGIYVLEPRLLGDVPQDQPLDFGRDLFPRWLEAGAVLYAQPMGGLVQDIGTPSGYLAAHRAALEGKTPRLEAGWRGALEERAAGVWASPSAKTGPEVEFTAPVLLGERCIIQSDAQVGPFAVIGADARIGPEARISNSVVWPHASIEAAARISGSVVASHATIGAGAILGRGTLVGEEAVVPAAARPPEGTRIRVQA